ncbi:hypothetical protein [Roseitranquillus sediminis]|uniref:hypothetical protein n=1 Tax=Roseitranquillus sediminis TaxID=2809051 RepID=UPI001D0C8820|nr:hypothetical protein [Roseitranquillus sediminis]MBM9596097.1 hypothetical protein [Roseitranquillus sediminis]
MSAMFAPDLAMPAEVADDMSSLRSFLAGLPRATRQACAVALAAQLVEDAAYFNAEDDALPLTSRLMMLSHDLSRIAGQFREAA